MSDQESKLLALRDKIEILCASNIRGRALVKACADPFDYALKLNTGEVIRFESAEFLDADWIRISDIKSSDIPYPAPRGLEVRISSIVWVMDAPEGS